MRWDAWLNESKNTKRLTLIFAASASAVLVLGAYWGITGVIGAAGISQAKKAIASESEAVGNAQATLLAAKGLPSGTGTDLSPAQAFMTEAHTAAGRNQCLLKDTLYQGLTPFARTFSDASGDGWDATPVQFSLQGTMEGIISTLRELSKVSEPYEFTGIDFNTAKFDDRGQAILTGTVGLVVLAKHKGT